MPAGELAGPTAASEVQWYCSVGLGTERVKHGAVRLFKYLHTFQNSLKKQVEYSCYSV